MATTSFGETFLVANETAAGGGTTEEVPTWLTCLEATFMIVIFMSSVIANLIVFALFYKKPSLLSISNRFVLNLAVSNFLMSLLVTPSVLVSAMARSWIFGDALCQVAGVLTTLLFAASIWTLVLVSLDRYCAIIAPLHYAMRITPPRCLYMMGAVWLVSAGLAVPPVAGWSHIQYQAEKCSCTVVWETSNRTDRYYTIFLAVVCFGLPCLIMAGAYSRIYRAAQKTTARARRNSVFPEPSSSTVTGLRTPKRRPSTDSLSKRRSSTDSIRSTFRGRRASNASDHPMAHIRDDWIAAKTGMVVMSTFLLCWIPHFTVMVLESTLSQPNLIPSWVERLALYLALSSCTVNPVVYVFRSRVMRYQLQALFARTNCTASGRRERVLELTTTSDSNQLQVNRRRASGSSLPTTSTCASSSSQSTAGRREPSVGSLASYTKPPMVTIHEHDEEITSAVVHSSASPELVLDFNSLTRRSSADGTSSPPPPTPPMYVIPALTVSGPGDLDGSSENIHDVPLPFGCVVDMV
ncbi:PREDICTED: histamine H2 receptor-like [Branchiostoma belcheri]|uniref:Histamine H2 receptor-like n=1 Tax=Branchiostoma belcheri TaxID=7741 RepID=A0A6P4Y5E9_BRABE|nr:PREDICTED: histamine H2 receptor-like [Branchiostoma belcheri]